MNSKTARTAALHTVLQPPPESPGSEVSSLFFYAAIRRKRIPYKRQLRCLITVIAFDGSKPSVVSLPVSVSLPFFSTSDDEDEAEMFTVKVLSLLPAMFSAFTVKLYLSAAVSVPYI